MTYHFVRFRNCPTLPAMPPNTPPMPRVPSGAQRRGSPTAPILNACGSAAAPRSCRAVSRRAATARARQNHPALWDSLRASEAGGSPSRASGVEPAVASCFLKSSSCAFASAIMRDVVLQSACAARVVCRSPRNGFDGQYTPATTKRRAATSANSGRDEVRPERLQERRRTESSHHRHHCESRARERSTSVAGARLRPFDERVELILRLQCALLVKGQRKEREPFTHPHTHLACDTSASFSALRRP